LLSGNQGSLGDCGPREETRQVPFAASEKPYEGPLVWRLRPERIFEADLWGPPQPPCLVPTL